ncbi:MAG: oligosaccharide flippase family protein [Candidatus Omnitrophica bacterium]|nr:oligosaccharide flippase family protein [Candidatus Omnitrophota bacterium]
MSFLQYGLQIVLQAVLAPLILKIAGRETLGAYAILMQVIGYGILLDLGFGAALGRYLAQAFGFDDSGARFVQTFNIGRTFYLFTNLIFGLLIIIFSFFVNEFLLVDDVILAQARLSCYLYGLWIIIRTPLVIYNYNLHATQNMAASNFIAILGNTSRLILSLILVFMKAGLVGLILANILAELIISSLSSIYFKKLFPVYKFGWGIKDRALFKDMFSFGRKYWGVNVAVLFLYGTDNMIVGYLYGAATASVYYTTKMPIFLLFQAILKLSENASPAANELFARKNFPALQSAYFRLLRYSMLLVVPLALGVISMNRLLVSVWINPQQYAGDFMTIFFAIFAIIAVLNHVNGTMIVVFANIRYWSSVSIIAGISNVLLALFLGKVFGFQWVAVSLVLASLPILMFLLSRSMQSLRIKFDQLWREVYKPTLIASIPIAILTIGIRQYDLALSWINLFMLTGLYIIFWMFGVYKFGINNAERNSVNNFLKLKSAGGL